MEKKVIFYSTHCPSCMMLERQLKAKGIDYEVCDDVEKMKAMKLVHAPTLKIEGDEKIMDFQQSIKWLKEM